jgi:hypothetical protein
MRVDYYYIWLVGSIKVDFTPKNNNNWFKTRKTKLSKQFFLKLQYIGFVSIFCPKYYY